MHDAAVESANFTECVPAPPGESCGSPVTEGGRTTSQPITLSRRPQARRRPLQWEETCERSLASRQSVVGPRWGMIRFNNCLR